MDVLVYLLGGAAIAAVVRWWQPRLRWAVAGAYLLLAGAFFGGALATSALQVPTDIAYAYRPWLQTLPAPVAPGNPLLYDVVTQMLPFRTLVRERLLRGEAPLWAHEIGAGQPLLGNGQSAPFALFHLMALPLPPLRAMTLAAVWQTLLALLLMHALARSLGAGEAGAVLSAVGYAFSTYLVAWAYYPIGMAACWVPGVLLGLVELRRGERGAMAGLVACGVGLAASGHPETLAHTAVAASACVVALLVRRQPGPLASSRGRFLVRLAIGTGLTAALAAPVLLPLVEVVRESERFAFIAAQEKFPAPAWETRALRVLIDPLAFGSPRSGNWTGPSNFNEMCTSWVGLVPLALAIAGAMAAIGLAVRRRIGNRQPAKVGERVVGAALGSRPLWLLLGAVLAGGAAFGVAPLIGLFHAVPGLAMVPGARLRLLVVVAMSLAAGTALEELMARRLGRWVTAGCIGAISLALLAVRPPAMPWQRGWWVVTLVGAGACLAALLLPPLRRWSPWIAVAATALDLALLGVRYNPLVSPALDLTPPPVLRPLLAKPDRLAFRVTGMSGELLPNLGALYGLADPRFYDPMHPWAVRAMIGPALGSGNGLVAVLDPARIAVGKRNREAPARSMLDYLGVRYMLVRPGGLLPLPWKRAWSDTGGRVWENPAAMPLFTMPARVERVDGQRQAIARAAANRDFRETGYLEADSSAPRDGVRSSSRARRSDLDLANATGPARAPQDSAPQRGQVSVRRVETNGFTVDVTTPTGGIVVSSVTSVRGWRIAIDERPVEPLRTNGAFVGFAVPPGRHRVVLDYRPAGWTWGLGLAAAGAIAAAALALVDRRRRRAAYAAAGSGLTIFATTSPAKKNPAT
ncbi:MAG TPA: YfhO family protein [Thermoanaerobaculia bacterium]|nr:YfhO family protein [Thermoanaerobaculia bacterium]